MSLPPLLVRSHHRVPVVSSTGGIPPNHPSLPLGPGGKGIQAPSSSSSSFLCCAASASSSSLLPLWFLHSWESCPLLPRIPLPNDACFSPALLRIYASLGSSALQLTASQILLNWSGVEGKQHKPHYSAVLTPLCPRYLFSLSERLGTDPCTEALG